jgi:uncharacterized protein YciI
MDHPDVVQRLAILDSVPIIEALDRCDAHFAAELSQRHPLCTRRDRALSDPAGSLRCMATFTVAVVNGPAWDPSRSRRKQADWTKHAAFMDHLVDTGFVILGGPIGDGVQVLLVVEASDEREIKDRFDQDPWIPTGVIKLATITPWTIWLDARQRIHTD